MKVLFIFLSLVFFSLSGNAKKLYKYQDQQGIWHFSDKPPDTRRKVEMRQLKPLRKRRVWLEKTGSERNPEFYIRNNFHGPVEVEVKFTENENAISNPVLPQRFIVQPGVSNTLFAIGGVDAYQPWGFTLQYRYIIGSSKAEHDASRLYLPPVAPGSKFQISQAFNGQSSHHDQQNKYAVDIVMPVGTPVHASRGGKVMEVENDFYQGGTENQAYQSMANSIRILHDDGTMAVYAHLELEKAQVSPGIRVKAGQLIGYSGNTGYSTGPHLHFAVQINKGMELVSIPFSFVNKEGETRKPVTGEWLNRVAN